MGVDADDDADDDVNLKQILEKIVKNKIAPRGPIATLNKVYRFFLLLIYVHNYGCPLWVLNPLESIHRDKNCSSLLYYVCVCVCVSLSMMMNLWAEDVCDQQFASIYDYIKFRLYREVND